MADIRKIIFKPVITERSTRLKESDNKFVFEVDRRANKREIKTAVEKLFGVTVKDVKTSIVRGKMKTTFMKSGRFTGKRPDRKKAFVTLAKGENIDIFDQV
ncbi:MAG: 50S ribosomal protein L23 [Candidatus Krumholzibacteria bacterium]|jgi:large subunit ribosomal protein L23|nr:50S ribosomal protein L23 [Candidatus Krumholzibacteria bacterium]